MRTKLKPCYFKKKIRKHKWSFEYSSKGTCLHAVLHILHWGFCMQRPTSARPPLSRAGSLPMSRGEMEPIICLITNKAIIQRQTYSFTRSFQVACSPSSPCVWFMGGTQGTRSQQNAREQPNVERDDIDAFFPFLNFLFHFGLYTLYTHNLQHQNQSHNL